MQGFLTMFNDILWFIMDGACMVFTTAFCLLVAGLGLYGIASVIYNLTLAHERRKEKRLESPTPRIRRIDYPDRDE